MENQVNKITPEQLEELQGFVGKLNQRSFTNRKPRITRNTSLTTLQQKFNKT